MCKFRKLMADEIEVKVSQVKQNFVRLLLYKTARTDMDMLDEVFGPENWEADYKEIKGNLYAGIGVYFPETGRTVWKWDCGIESRQDGEGNEKKGEASDAFKRAGFKWGIGRELYTAPEIKVDRNGADIKTVGNTFRCYDKFYVEKLLYDESGRISALSIKNATLQKRCFVMLPPEKEEKHAN